jgi:hypothetical protein
MTAQFRWPDDVDPLCDRVWKARYALTYAQRNSEFEFGDIFADLCESCDDLANQRETMETDAFLWQVALADVERTWNAAHSRGESWTLLPEFTLLRKVIDDGWAAVTP